MASQFRVQTHVENIRSKLHLYIGTRSVNTILHRTDEGFYFAKIEDDDHYAEYKLLMELVQNAFDYTTSDVWIINSDNRVEIANTVDYGLTMRYIKDNIHHEGDTLNVIWGEMYGSTNYDAKKETSGIHGLGCKIVAAVRDITVKLSTPDGTRINTYKDGVSTPTISKKKANPCVMKVVYTLTKDVLPAIFGSITLLQSSSWNQKKKLYWNDVLIPSHDIPSIFMGTYYPATITAETKSKQQLTIQCCFTEEPILKRSVAIVNGNMIECGSIHDVGKAYLESVFHKFIKDIKIGTYVKALYIVNTNLIEYESNSKAKVITPLTLVCGSTLDGILVDSILSKCLRTHNKQTLGSNYRRCTNKTCNTLWIVEGLSARSGLECIMNRSTDSSFAITGKLLNIIKSPTQTPKNHLELLAAIAQSNPSQIVIATDPDPDGYHIFCLILATLIHNKCPVNWHKIRYFVLPLYKDSKGRYSYTEPSTKIDKYFKGIGSFTKQDLLSCNAKCLPLNYNEESLQTFFNLFGKSSEARKSIWYHQSIVPTFDKTLSLDSVNTYMYKKFFSEVASRTIPGIDGLKRVQRQILHTVLKSSTKTFKVIGLIGDVIKTCCYEHGDASLAKAIIYMAQDFNNYICLLVPDGCFGTRCENGVDAASPRYISTGVSEAGTTIFASMNDIYLRKYITYRCDGPDQYEPTLYPCLFPLLLINGANGIASGYKSLIPSCEPELLIRYILQRLQERQDDASVVDTHDVVNPDKEDYQEFFEEEQEVECDNMTIHHVKVDTKLQLPPISFPCFNGFIEDVSTEEAESFILHGTVSDSIEGWLSIDELPPKISVSKVVDILTQKNIQCINHSTDDSICLQVKTTEEELISLGFMSRRYKPCYTIWTGNDIKTFRRRVELYEYWIICALEEQERIRLHIIDSISEAMEELSLKIWMLKHMIAIDYKNVESLRTTLKSLQAQDSNVIGKKLPAFDPPASKINNTYLQELQDEHDDLRESKDYYCQESAKSLLQDYLSQKLSKLFSVEEDSA